MATQRLLQSCFASLIRNIIHFVVGFSINTSRMLMPDEFNAELKSSCVIISLSSISSDKGQRLQVKIPMTLLKTTIAALA